MNILQMLDTAYEGSAALRALAKQFGGPLIGPAVASLEAVVTAGEALLSDETVIANGKVRADIEARVTQIRAESKRLAVEIDRT